MGNLGGGEILVILLVALLVLGPSKLPDAARQLGKITIAEFVSDASSMTVLFSIGVDLVQGNFLAPPMVAMNYEFG